MSEPALQYAVFCRDMITEPGEISILGIIDAVIGNIKSRSAEPPLEELSPPIRHSLVLALGLIGVGRIGTVVANRARAFGMHVIGYDCYVEYADLVELKSFEEVLASSDYISLHVPLCVETEGMINKETIAMMKDGVVIINTGRGKCVIEQDLVDALESGKVKAFGTDVWYSDPPP